MPQITGEQFVSILTKEFGVEVPPVTKHQWRHKPEVSPTLLRNALEMFERQKLAQAVQPIVEFHKLNMHHQKKMDTFASRIVDKSVIEELKKTSGIYAFFEAQGRLVYIGKTEKSLMTEMDQRYKNKDVSFRVLKNGKAVWEPASIKNIAVYFSAYKIHGHLIKNVEALLTRIIVNSASTFKVEQFATQKEVEKSA